MPADLCRGCSTAMRVALLLSLSLASLSLAGCDSQGRDGDAAHSQASSAVSKSQPASTLPIAIPAPTPRPPGPQDWFAEISTRAGVNFTYQNGRDGQKFTILESVGGGAAFFDFDHDDNLDLFVTGGGTIKGSPIVIGGLPNALFRNSGESTFVDSAVMARISSSANYTVGCSVCDYNCDGQPDLFITGYPQCQLYCNQGDGTFLDVTLSAGLKFNDLSTASTWGDFNGDGWPELFVAGYVKFDLREDRNCGEELRRIRDICGIWQYPSAPDRLYANGGDGTFHEITTSAGLRSDGKGLGAVAADINEDGALDLYVGNDFTPNFLYLGDGRGQFQEQGLISGTAFDANGAPQGSMGVDFGDYDGDGRGDLFVTNYQLEDNTLYRNLGDLSFAVATAQTGLQDVCRPFVGFGTGWVDFDSDGWLDLFILNGHVMYQTGQSPYEQPQFLFRNRDGQRFENRSEHGGPYFSIPHVARGGAAGDFNNDGAADLVVVHQNSPVSLLTNRLPPQNWIRLCLCGTRSDPFAVGATVTVKFEGRNLVRHVRGGSGYLSHFDRRILLPSTSDGPIDASVRWLNGRRETFRNLRPNQTNQLIEGQGTSD